MNEYVDNSEEWYKNKEDQYNELAYAGIICQSSTEISFIQQTSPLTSSAGLKHQAAKRS